MAATHLSLVNQKLAYLRSILSQLESIDPEQRGTTMATRALVDAGLFHLNVAYQFYLRELAEVNRLKTCADIYSLTQLKARLDALGRSPSEVQELCVLTGQPESWLAMMLSAYEAIFLSPPPVLELKAFPVHENAIPLIDVTAATAIRVYSPSDLAAASQAFIALIGRQRETSAEY